MISFLQIFLQPSLCNAYRGSPTYAVFTNADPTMYRVFWLMYAQVGDFCVSSGSPTVPLTRILRNEVFSSRKIKGDLMQKSQFKHVNCLEQQQQCVKSTGFHKSCKNRKKVRVIDPNFQTKSCIFCLQVGLKFAFQINYTEPDFS